MKTLIFDIEAIRDHSLWSPPEPESMWPLTATMQNGEVVLQGLMAPQRAESFAPPYAWIPIVIGCVALSDGAGGDFIVDKIGAIDVPKIGSSHGWEYDLLERFANAIAKMGNPELVTWNGRAFDLPVLMYRSMRHGIAHPWFYRSKTCRYRYNEDGHCDLADAMTDYGATQKLKLDGIAKLIGLPGKYADIDGAGVAQAFEAGRHDEIASYCLSDAVQTAFVFLRWQLLKGTINVASYRRSATALLDACAAEERLAGFPALVDRRLLLLEKEQNKEAA